MVNHNEEQPASQDIHEAQAAASPLQTPHVMYSQAEQQGSPSAQSRDVLSISEAAQPSCAASAQAPPKRGWIVALVAIIAAFIVLMFALWSCSTALSSLAVSGTSTTEASMLTSPAVGVITLNGTIQYDGSVCSPEGFKKQLDIAAENDNIVAVVLRVNSGGGTATAGEEMAAYVAQFCKETGKPIVVSSAASNASAAYEISSQADYIYTAKTTTIGSIGTALQLVDYSDLLEMLGISVDNITSSDGKDSTYGTRELTEEEREYYQSMVDEINQTFIENVAAGRNMSIAEVEELASGLTFTGTEAIRNGLADEIGTKEDAVTKAADLAGYKNIDTVNLKPASSSDLSMLLDLLGESRGTVIDGIIEELKDSQDNDIS